MNNETRSTFETLEAWKMARNLRKEISRLTESGNARLVGVHKESIVRGLTEGVARPQIEFARY